MGKTVEFFFDFGSPASYLAWTQLPRLAAEAGATIAWRPMLLGGVFKATGNQSPVTIPAKGRWMNDDIRRWAKRYGVPFAFNPHFPINTLTLMRGAAGVQLRQPGRFDAYLKAVFEALAGSGCDLVVALGRSQTETGLLMTPWSVAMAFTALFAGKLAWFTFWGWQLVIVAAAISLPLAHSSTGLPIGAWHPHELLFGYAADEMLGESVNMLVPEHARAAHPGMFERFFESRGLRLMSAVPHLTARRKNGTELAVEISISATSRNIVTRMKWLPMNSGRRSKNTWDSSEGRRLSRTGAGSPNLKVTAGARPAPTPGVRR